MVRRPVLFRLLPIVSDGGGAPFRGATVPLPAIGRVLAGVSRDSAGAALGGCTCTLLKVNTTGAEAVFTQVATTVSDGAGNYSFVVGFEGPYRVMFDLAGAPVLAGITLKTLSGA